MLIKPPYIFAHLNGKFISMVLIGALVVSGCSQGKAPQHEAEIDNVAESMSSSTDMAVTNMPDTDLSTTSMDSFSSEILPSNSTQNLTSDSNIILNTTATDIEVAGKKLVINVEADFKVADVVKSSNAIEILTQQQGGYVAQSNISNQSLSQRVFQQGDDDITLTTYYRQANMTLRIPRQKVSEFLRQLQQQITFLNAHNFTAQDVTLDLYRQQLESKLNADMADELSGERLNSHNDKDQNSNVDSITATYAAKEQQQMAKLQRLAIADQVAFSTIHLSFSQPDIVYKEVSKNLESVIATQQPSFSTQAYHRFVKGWDSLKVVVLGVIGLWWLWLLAITAYLLFKIIKKVYQRLQHLNHKQPHGAATIQLGEMKVENDDPAKAKDKN
ncbi:DUF4349 domain-containing protein [Psychrobacter sp. I-STPA10]|uniref:DUF4349 domain-containing protein n=1 Tax=Psychrobacter sp. I-STPA10 TaxID=2585769 RepID=UPI001E3D4CB2|nr:DUF4349 domain-containing protein [Psychrobacter sp. I-STPA10]